MDIFVKERVKWPHEFVLAGSTKDRNTYNQLNITQWMSGFCRILRDENCQKIRDHMLDYSIALLDDSNDFSWQAAKASHAVLLFCIPPKPKDRRLGFKILFFNIIASTISTRLFKTHVYNSK